jgi:hypothetical protein
VSSPLETLRAFSRSARPQYEINETNEITPPQPLSAPVSSFNSFLSSPGNADNLDERAAIVEYGAGVPREWAEGFAALSTMPAPTGFSTERWARIVDAAGVFLDRWAPKAAELGWVDVEIFGCDGSAPAARFDLMGLVLLLERMRVIAIDATGADLLSNTGDVRQRYRRKPTSPHAVRLWDLATGGDHPPDIAA